ncbi:MAG: HipA domain-containing protein [Burkholderiales bacterium]
MRLEVYCQDEMAGWLEHDPDNNLFALSYAPSWHAQPLAYPLSPHLPLDPVEGQSAEAHSAIVRQFFENLLPEGTALDDAAAANRLSKSNLVGLMLALGKETAGALRIQLGRDATDGEMAVTPIEPEQKYRHLSPEELSERIRARPAMPFSVWDGKVRLSIAGFQDKIAVLKTDEGWHLAEGRGLASTVILKPEPINPRLAGLTTNEFFCMRLALHAGLPVANVRLVHVPEPVLEITRFDRETTANGILRRHVVDGCQALGISVGMKYERPYGDTKEVRHIRDGASLPRLFGLLDITNRPAAQRLALLRWALFQILVGNADAHAKNLSFFVSAIGTYLTPAYDVVCTLAYADSQIDDNFAMAIGDAFTEGELTAYEWAQFAANCRLSPRLVSIEMLNLVHRIRDRLPVVRAEVVAAGGQAPVVQRVVDVVNRMCLRHEQLARLIVEVDTDQFPD